jgi:hypothetical protein
MTNNTERSDNIMYQYKGYWFWSLRDDTILKAKNLLEEYCILNCPQEYEGPFLTEDDALEYRLVHPNLHKSFIKAIKEMEEIYFA